MRYYINYDFENNNDIKNVGVVIAHYKEDLEWVDSYFPEDFSIYIYSKGDEKPNIKRDYYHEMLDNVGRCDHTYLYHIIRNYNNLNKYNIFITGSSYILRHKKEKMDGILNIIKKDKLEKVEYYPRTKLERPNFLNTGMKYDYAYTMRMPSHCAAHSSNKRYNFLGYEDCKIVPSNHNSLEHFKNSLINKRDITSVTYYGVFVVKKNLILKNDKNIYKNLLNELNNGDNVENGHFMERLWAHLFIS